MAAEEGLILKHGDNNIQGDPREYLKSLERDRMLEIWKAKAPKQAEWISEYPRQIVKQAKKVWHWAVERGEGQAWVYFIFAVCQWLPTNYRINAHQNKEEKTKCLLCLADKVENMEHLLTCPALVAEHLQLQAEVEEKLRICQFPFIGKLVESRENKTRTTLMKACRP